MTTRKFSREELQKIIDTDHVQCGDAAALAGIILEGMDSKPVAYTSATELQLKDLFADMWRTPFLAGGDIPLYSNPYHHDYSITEAPPSKTFKWIKGL